jgi:hypothetical protein
VNVVHSTNNFNYAYAHNTHAVTATSRSGFTGGQAVNRGAAHINEASLRGAQVTNNLGVSPSRQSAFGAANARGNVSRPPSSVENRSVMARTSPGAGASHIPVHTMNTNGLAGSAATTGRQNNLSKNGPASAGGNNSRVWSAQGNTTDRGQAPKGFGSSTNSPSNNSTMSARANNRPPWAGSGAAAYAGNGRSYTPPQGNSTYSNRGYTPQSRSYSAPAPSRSYSAPNRTYSAPSRSYGGGGGGASHAGGAVSHGGGGGASHGGGGGSHGHR